MNAVTGLAAGNGEPERAGVVNNTFHGYGRGPLAEVMITGSCRFSDNQCSGLTERVEVVVVDVTAQAVIAAQNGVEGSQKSTSLKLTVGKVEGVDCVTVLGNVAGDAFW